MYFADAAVGTSAFAAVRAVAVTPVELVVAVPKTSRDPTAVVPIVACPVVVFTNTISVFVADADTGTLVAVSK
jgi:hypothetical protein